LLVNEINEFYVDGKIPLSATFTNSIAAVFSLKRPMFKVFAEKTWIDKF